MASIEKPCGTPNAVKSSFAPPVKVKVTVDNTGDCSLVVKLAAGAETLTTATIRPGSGAIPVANAGVDSLVIDCVSGQGEGGRQGNCKFTYSIEAG